MSINWTKEWQAADDGVVLRAIDLKNIQDDIDANIGDATTIHGFDIEIPSSGADGMSLIWDNNNSEFVFDFPDRIQDEDNDTIIRTEASADEDVLRFDAAGAEKMDISSTGIRMGGANARVTTILDEDDMASNSATALTTQQSIKAYIDGRRSVEIFRASGTWVAPTGVTEVFVHMVGGGGGGGGTGANANAAAGGGGGGASTLGVRHTVTPGNSYTVTIGAGGTAGATGGGTGGTGGTTSFDTLSCLGGSGGVGDAAGAGAAGGAGGVGGFNASGITGGTFKFTGGNGAAGVASNDSGGGGGTPFGTGADGKAQSGGAANAGTVNTGVGGGGAVDASAAGGVGGSGVVHLIYAVPST